MATSALPPSNGYELDITIISGKHLKNVNWRVGPLKPYCIFWVDPAHRLATKSDDSGSTKPVWNQQFTLPLPHHPLHSLLSLEIFHSKPSQTPKPLIGITSIPIKDLVNEENATLISYFEVQRPSGRPQGKIKIKLALRHRPLTDYRIAPQRTLYYSSAPPPPPGDYKGYSFSAASPPLPPPSSAPVCKGYSFSEAPPPPLPSSTLDYKRYFEGHCFPATSLAPPPPPSSARDYKGYNFAVDSLPQPSAARDYKGYNFSTAASSTGDDEGFNFPGEAPPPSFPSLQPYQYGGGGYSGGYPSYYQGYYAKQEKPDAPPQLSNRPGPSAPVDYAASYDQQRVGGLKGGLGTGIGVGAVAGALGGLALDEGIKYDKDQVFERVESHVVAKEDYGNYRVDY